MKRWIRLMLGLGYAMTESGKVREGREQIDRIADRLEDLTDHASRRFDRSVGRVERFYRSVRGQEHHTMAHAVSFLVGIGIGAGAGLLFAPASGLETREAIAKKVQHLKNDMREHLHPESSPEVRTA